MLNATRRFRVRRLAYILALVSALVAAGCGGSDVPSAADVVSSDSSVESVDEAVEPTLDETAAAAVEGSLEDQWLSSWIVNDDGETSSTIGTDNVVNVQSVEVVEIDGVRYAMIEASDIPGYEYEISKLDEALLRSRPRYESDFGDDELLVSAGDIIQFGDDMGFLSACDGEANAGAGFWPPGPACATVQESSLLLPLSPELAADGEETTTGLGQIGLFVNGVSIFGWGDGMSYNNDRVWFNLAPIAESLDLDICPGHSANGEYHHHSYPACLAAELGDDGQDHSPIYGFAADGFPIYGPWVAVGQLAESSWVTRDLDDPDSPYACGEVGVRTCVMVDQMDPTLGVITADSAGPDTTDEVESLSGNTFTASAGYYFEDHYYDEARNDGTLAALDDHNGHDHDGLGYHYHVTSLLDDDGRLVDVFPYYLGPQLAGVVLEMSR